MSDRDDSLEVMCRLQSQLQERLGTHPAVMSDEERVRYILMNVVALTDELHEALAETYWKPWASSPPGFRDRDKYVRELSDAMHFLLNLYLAAGADAGEILALYEGKNKVNHERQDRGYTGNDKCDNGSCRRELDDPLQTVRSVTMQGARFMFCSPDCMAAFMSEMEGQEAREDEDPRHGDDRAAVR